jgi:hypothetical protein
MRVTITKEVEYTPTTSDHRSCWGSLHRKPGADLDGKCGPMIYYFPKGRTPELRDEIAEEFIACGVAESFRDEPTIDKTTTEILAGMAVSS